MRPIPHSHRSSLRPVIRLVGTAVLACLVLAACGSSDDADTDTSADSGSGPGAGASTSPDTTAAPTDAAPGPSDVDFDRDPPETYEPTVQEALDVFATAFEPVPGSVEPAQDATPDPEQAVVAVTAVWSQLSAAQQTAIEAALANGVELIGIIGPDGELVEDATAPAAGGRRARGAQDTGAQRQILLTDLAQIRRDLDVRLGDRLTAIVGLSVEATPRPDGEDTAWAVASGGSALGGGVDCHIVVGQNLLRATETNARSLLAHELFHCYQFDFFPDGVEAAAHMPTWLREGTAAWVGEAFVGGSTVPLADSWWRTYLGGHSSAGVFDGRFSLFDSSYAAIGFFAHLEKLGVDVWTRVLPASQHRTSTEGFDFLTLGNEARLASWGASVLRTPAWGDAWDARVIGAHPERRTPLPIEVTFDAYANTRRVARGYNGVTEFRLPGEAEIADVNVTGTGVTSWAGSDEQVYAASGRTLWCLGRSCVCPDGAPPAGVTLQPAPAATPLTVALAGITGSSRADVRALMTEALCEAPICSGDGAPAGAGGRRSRPAPVRQPVETPEDPRCAAPDAPAGPECLVGSWGYDAATLPVPPAVTAAPLSGVRFSGMFILTFTADGAVSINLDGYRMDATAPLAGADGEEVPSPVSVVFYGSLRNTYTFDGATLGVSFVESSLGADVTMALPGAGEFTFPFPPPAIAGFVPALAGGAGGSVSSTAVCTATTLTLTAPSGTVFSLERV